VTVRLPTDPGARRLAILIGIAAAAVALVFTASLVFGGPSRQVQTGIVVAVESTSLTDGQGFSIRTADGQTWDFRVVALENATTFPPGHLAEHKVSLVPVQVTYVDRNGAHEAVRVVDAP
jgi:hypothetical protein